MWNIFEKAIEINGCTVQPGKFKECLFVKYERVDGLVLNEHLTVSSIKMEWLLLRKHTTDMVMVWCYQMDKSKIHVCLRLECDAIEMHTPKCSSTSSAEAMNMQYQLEIVEPPAALVLSYNVKMVVDPIERLSMDRKILIIISKLILELGWLPIVSLFSQLWSDLNQSMMTHKIQIQVTIASHCRRFLFSVPAI